VLDEFHHLFDTDRLKVMTKASQWLKVLIVNTGIPVVVCGMPEAEHVLRAEHTERRFKERLALKCFTWQTPTGRREFCGMLKKLDDSLPLVQPSKLAEQPNPFIGPLDKSALDRVQPADEFGTAGIGLTPRAAHQRKRKVTASDYLGGR
jgi:hypothetical protein